MTLSMSYAECWISQYPKGIRGFRLSRGKVAETYGQVEKLRKRLADVLMTGLQLGCIESTRVGWVVTKGGDAHWGA